MGAVLAISVGASIGALARWGLGLWLTPGGVIPWGTLAANLVGGYLIGVCLAVFQALPDLDPAWRLAIVTGFLGGHTGVVGGGRAPEGRDVDGGQAVGGVHRKNQVALW